MSSEAVPLALQIRSRALFQGEQLCRLALVNRELHQLSSNTESLWKHAWSLKWPHLPPPPSTRQAFIRRFSSLAQKRSETKRAGFRFELELYLLPKDPARTKHLNSHDLNVEDAEGFSTPAGSVLFFHGAAETRCLFETYCENCHEMSGHGEREFLFVPNLLENKRQVTWSEFRPFDSCEDCRSGLRLNGDYHPDCIQPFGRRSRATLTVTNMQTGATACVWADEKAENGHSMLTTHARVVLEGRLHD